MRRVTYGLFIGWMLTYGLGRIQAAPPANSIEYTVTTPPAELKLPRFFRKHVSASGFPVVGSAKVNDYALKEAAHLIDQLLAQRPDIRKAMIEGGSRMVVMAHNEFTTDVPGHAHLTPKVYWDRRARGLGGSEDDPICSCGEENLLCFAGDPYHEENILIHEFAHHIHLRGMAKVDPAFDRRLKQAFERATAAGLWQTKYAGTNRNEYFAEGVQSWFNNNRPPDHDHNHVDTRAELLQYDPGLAALCKEVFRDTKFEYTRPTQRLQQPHLAGYNPETAPTFRWPKRLEDAQKQIDREVAERTGER